MSSKGKGYRYNTCKGTDLLRHMGNKAYDKSNVYSEMALHLAKKHFKKL